MRLWLVSHDFVLTADELFTAAEIFSNPHFRLQRGGRG
jgi:hypothetical protein